MPYNVPLPVPASQIDQTALLVDRFGVPMGGATTPFVTGGLVRNTSTVYVENEVRPPSLTLNGATYVIFGSPGNTSVVAGYSADGLTPSAASGPAVRNFPYLMGVANADRAKAITGATTTGIGVQATAQQPVTTNNGEQYYHAINTGSANQDSTLIVPGPARLLAGSILSAIAGRTIVKFYDKATAPTAADTPVLLVTVPGNSGRELDSAIGVWGMRFALGMCYRIVTGLPDGDTTGVAANSISIDVSYVV